MKALTFVSIILLAMSGATARSVTAQPVEVAAATSQAHAGRPSVATHLHALPLRRVSATRLKCGPDIRPAYSRFAPIRWCSALPFTTQAHPMEAAMSGFRYRFRSRQNK